MKVYRDSRQQKAFKLWANLGDIKRHPLKNCLAKRGFFALLERLLANLADASYNFR